MILAVYFKYDLAFLKLRCNNIAIRYGRCNFGILQTAVTIASPKSAIGISQYAVGATVRGLL
jgi:hypothetical protein